MQTRAPALQTRAGMIEQSTQVSWPGCPEHDDPYECERNGERLLHEPGLRRALADRIEHRLWRSAASRGGAAAEIASFLESVGGAMAPGEPGRPPPPGLARSALLYHQRLRALDGATSAAMFANSPGALCPAERIWFDLEHAGRISFWEVRENPGEIADCFGGEVVFVDAHEIPAGLQPGTVFFARIAGDRALRFLGARAAKTFRGIGAWQVIRAVRQWTTGPHVDRRWAALLFRAWADEGGTNAIG